MPLQSNLWFAAVDPDSVPTPAPGYYALFISNGTRNTAAGVVHKKDSSGAISTTTSTADEFDPAGAADAAQAAAIAASQPLDDDLTAIAALATTDYGRSLLTVASATDNTDLLNTASPSVKGLLSAADKTKLDALDVNRGVIGNLASAQSTTGTGSPYALLTVRVPSRPTTVGQMFRFRLLGNSSSNGNLTFRVYAGTNGTTGDAVCWTSNTSSAQAANQRAGFEGTLTVRAIGSNGSVQCEALGFAGNSLLPTTVAPVTTPTVNTLNAWSITLAVTVSSGTFTAQQAMVEAL